MRFSTTFFDLDDTIYPHSTGIWEEIRHRMDLYMHDRLKMPWDEIPEIRKTYLETYGTTLRGLQNQMQIDTQDFLEFVHDVPVNKYLKRNEPLRKILLSLPQKRWIFTNSDHSHATRVLSALGLLDCFQGIIDVYALKFVPKPDPLAFKKGLDLASAKAENCIFFDDAVRNLFAASQLGFTTVLVGPTNQDTTSGIHYHVTKLEDMPDLMPWLWN